MAYAKGDRVRYAAAPVFDLIVKTGEVGVVERTEGEWVYAWWPRSGLHGVPSAHVQPADQPASLWRIEFRWKEQVIYWEEGRGCVFDGAWGVEPPVTVVPDSNTWDAVVPPWLLGRHDEVVERLRAEPDHVVKETPDYLNAQRTLPEITQ